MTALHPVELFSLTVPPNGEPVAGLIGSGEKATFRITMAAIDPTAPLSTKGQTNGAPAFTGSVLKIIRVDIDEDDSDFEDDEDSMDMAQLLDQSDSEDESEDEDSTGAPSDPAKSPKARRLAELQKAIADAQDAEDNEEDEDDDMDLDGSLSSKAKGKGKLQDDDEDDEELDSDDEDSEGAQQAVLCTLDPAKAYQQTLDITVSEYETVFFSATGTHKIYLTGNVLFPVNMDDDYDDEDDEDDDDYGMPEGLEGLSDEDESDELDDIEDPRVTELASEDEEDTPPKLIKIEKAAGKGKNKRPLEDSSEIEAPKDELKLKADKKSQPAAAGAEVDEAKLSKTQLKKLKKKQKNNEGNAVEPTAVKVNGTESTPDKSDKKVQFAKELVQGPSGSAQPNGDVAKGKTEKKPVDAPKVNGDAAKPNDANKSKVRTVQGVNIDDRKPGAGPGAKKGSKVSMRYIGKLEGPNGRTFDSNKKGPPFKFTLGTGQVIKGWDVGLQGIAVGGERRITCPPQMAYGSKKNGDIPANSTLVFDVKCLAVD